VNLNSKIVLSLPLILLLFGCESTPTTTERISESGLPDWYLNPNPQSGGFAAAECVDDNASLSILRSKATALARSEIAAQMDIGVNRMEESLIKMQEIDGTSAVNETFSQDAKQVVSRELRSSQVKKVDYFTDSQGQRLLCVFVGLDPQIARTVYDQMLSETRRNLSPQSDTILYREFTRKLTENELRQVREDVRD